MSSNEKEVREKILSKYLENPGIKLITISKQLKTSYKTVIRTINKYKKGLSIERKPGSGRNPGPTDPDVLKKIKVTFSQKPGTSERDMARIAGSSKSTVHRYKKFAGYKTYKVQKVPFRQEEAEAVARKRARKLYEGYLTKFSCILMDDETYCKADFTQLPGNAFYTTKNKAMINKRFSSQGISKFPRKFMIWQAICSCGLRTDEFVIKGTINSNLYIQECLQKRLLPFIQQHNGPVLFWPDLATSHYAKTTMEWYADNNINIVPKCANPANCPELRPIEKYWAFIKRELRKTKETAKNEVDLKIKWKRTYKTITSTTVQNLMNNIKKSVKQFYKKK